MFSGVSEERFSLRMLEPNEYYFDDFTVEYYPNGNVSTRKDTIRGTLKICSKSLVFVPSNRSDSIIRIRQKVLTSIAEFEQSDTRSNLITDKVSVHFQ